MLTNVPFHVSPSHRLTSATIVLTFVNSPCILWVSFKSHPHLGFPLEIPFYFWGALSHQLQPWRSFPVIRSTCFFLGCVTSPASHTVDLTVTICLHMKTDLMMLLYNLQPPSPCLLPHPAVPRYTLDFTVLMPAHLPSLSSPQVPYRPSPFLTCPSFSAHLICTHTCSSLTFFVFSLHIFRPHMSNCPLHLIISPHHEHFPWWLSAPWGTNLHPSP